MPHGSLEITTGPMFSGKTEHLIQRIISSLRAGKSAVALKPAIDHRYAADALVSHSGHSFPALQVQTDSRVSLVALGDYTVVGIDEVQFFGPWIADEIMTLLSRGVDVFVSGLDLTYKGEPFGPMPKLLCLADTVIKIAAVCAQCGSPATRTFRKEQQNAEIFVGGAEMYEPRCTRCFSSTYRLT